MGNNKQSQIDQQKTLQTFEYKDGKLYWKVRTSKRTVIGQEAGTITSKGYRAIAWNKHIYRAHHLVYLMFNGVFPDQLDHIDGNKQNNKIENLRIANNSENQWNKKIYVNNKTGHKNVKWIERLGKYVVVVAANKKNKHIGVFGDLDEACIAAQKARNLYHGNFACHQ